MRFVMLCMFYLSLCTDTILLFDSLVNAGLRSPALEVCQDLQSELTLTFPQPEHLQGVPAHYDPEICKMYVSERLIFCWFVSCCIAFSLIKVLAFWCTGCEDTSGSRTFFLCYIFWRWELWKTRSIVAADSMDGLWYHDTAPDHECRDTFRNMTHRDKCVVSRL